MTSKALQTFVQRRRVGYFSMEIALRSEIPTYAGGLGVLAGDMLRSAADMSIPIVAVTPVSRHGYFRQTIGDNGAQQEQPDPWDPAKWAEPLPAKTAVEIAGRQVWVTGWLYVVEGLSSKQPVILLDTDLPENDERDRRLTDVLYGGDDRYRLGQEIVLGIGGLRLLDALGFRIDLYHLNEGHSALLAVELLRRHSHSVERRDDEPLYDIAMVREQCHFTTHTPVDAAHDWFRYDLVEELLDEFIDLPALKRLAGQEALNTTQLALNLSEYVNGVAKRHAQTANRLYPGHHMSAITNGVHPYTWTHPEFAALYDAQLPGWRLETELLMRADCCLDEADVWRCHASAKRELIARVRSETGVDLDPELPLVGCGRRVTQYKRPELLFTDLPRLMSICEKSPFQLVLAGKAHPKDEDGKRSIERLHRLIAELHEVMPIVFLPNYGMDVARAMVSGADIWLNTPQPPLEASGTSGMKAALNGVPNLSVLDGWWVEGHIEGITGWAIGNGEHESDGSDAESLYEKLEHVVLPLYADRARWITLMKSTISRNASMFHSHRMMRRYAAESYLT